MDDVGVELPLAPPAQDSTIPDFVTAPDDAYLHSLETVSDFGAMERLLCAKMRLQAAPGLRSAIECFSAYLVREHQAEPGVFWSQMLPNIVRWALDHASAHPVVHLAPGVEQTASFSRRYTRHLLANAFLGIPLRETSAVGNIHQHALYHNVSGVGIHRVVCNLAYFFLAANDSEAQLCEHVRFERKVLCAEDAVDWLASSVSLLAPPVMTHADGMETFGPPANFVNFANRDLQIHCCIPSATQEEVLFSCAPEAFVGMLVAERMAINECILVRGLRRFSTYVGYLSTFRFNGFAPQPAVSFESLAIDAQIGENYGANGFVRDLNKAFVGFRAVAQAAAPDTGVLSTGGWGCGAFGGDEAVKFIQQVCVAAVVGVKLHYSAYRNQERLAMFNELMTAMSLLGTVGAALRLMWKFRDQLDPMAIGRRSPFGPWYCAAAKQLAAARATPPPVIAASASASVSTHADDANSDDADGAAAAAADV